MASSYDKRPSTSEGGHHSRSSQHHHHRRHHRSRERSPDSSRLRPEPRNTSTRHGTSPRPGPSSRAPSPLPPPQLVQQQQQQPQQQQPISTSRAPRRWPPAPAVEDERASLARESNVSLAGSDISDTPSRGSVDQQPIILEVDGVPQSSSSSFTPSSKGTKQERRPYFSDPPSQSRPESGAKSMRPPPSADLEVPDTPLYTRRAPSPYRFTPKPKDGSQVSSTDSGYYSDKRSSPPSGIEAMTNEALRDRGKPAVEDPSGVAAEFTAAEDESIARAASERKSTPYSFVPSSVPDRSSKPPVREHARGDGPQRLAEIKADASPLPRRSSDSATNMPRPSFDHRNTNPSPLTIPSSMQAAAAAAAAATVGAAAYPSTSFHVRPSGSRPNSRPNSRPSSPVEMPSFLPPSPPRSPRVGSHYSKDSPHSARSSASGSVSGSRPSSPSSGYPPPPPQEGVRRSSTFPVITEDRSQRTSRLASSSHIDDVQSPVSRPSALPYPVDDMNIMPSEEDQRYRPRPLGDGSSSRPSSYSSRPSTREGPLLSPATSRPTSLEAPPRPKAQSRHSLDTSLPVLATAVAASLASPKEPETPIVDRASETGLHRPRARCFQTQSNRSYDGWYVLNGLSNFDMCPSCFDKYISQTVYASNVRQVYRREPNPHVYCSFSSPWIKLAWKMTQKQQRPDLGLLYAVIQASESESPCPGKTREARAWHTAFSSEGDYVHGFDVCPCDARKIEAIMPSLRGVFQPSNTSGRKRRCNLRTDSTRFQEYLYTLMDIDASAARRSNAPNMAEFIELARHKAQMRECSRDELVLDQGWHFAPQLPEFTVCEECYSAIIWPAIAENSPVASKFKRTPELVDEDKEFSPGSQSRRIRPTLPGTSCQLYSDRMRQIFFAAVKDNDFNYLARRAKARKETELALHVDFALINADLREIERQYTRPGDRHLLENHPQRAQLLNEIGKISEDWRKWE